MIKHIVQRILCRSPGGLSVANAALIVKAAKISNSRVDVACRGKACTTRNIFELLSMGMEYGDLVVVSVCGEDAEATLNNIELLFKDYALNSMGPDCFTPSAA